MPESEGTELILYGGSHHLRRVCVHLPYGVPVPDALLIDSAELYRRLNDPDTGAWLGAYVFEPTPTPEDHHAEDLHRPAPWYLLALRRGAAGLRGLFRHGR